MNGTTRYRVIEASAGTGKTYRIEEEMIAALRRGVRLERVLVMTYTEQATGELRKRIRAKISANLAGGDLSTEESDRLRDALDRFDCAAIYTIHGFCQRTLQQYAFENGQLLNCTVIKSRSIWDRLFAAQVRTYWRDYLESADESKRAEVLEKGFYKKIVLEIAQKLMPSDIIVPGDSARREEAIVGTLNELSDILGTIPEDVSASDAILAVENCGEHHSTRRSMKTPLLSLLEIMRSHQNGEPVIERLDEWARGLAAGILKLTEHGLPSPKSADLIVNKLLAYLGDPNRMAISRSISCLVKSSAKYKSENGLIDYNDMLTLVCDALRDPAGTLLHELRAKYDCAIIDEFQDTDPVQWEIISRIFADDAHDLILVGDPKQAIYGFRGANVYTYLGATELLRNSSAEVEPLDTNYRSDAGLISGLNTIFADWFTSGISYQNVSSPDTPPQLVCDPSGRSPISIVDLENEDEAHRKYCEFIADEIERLLECGIEIADGPDSRPLRASDICILYRGSGELPTLEKALARVPYTMYKRSGLFASDQAAQISYLLKSLASPSDIRLFRKALLTRFFAIAPCDLWWYEDLRSNSPIRELFVRWQELCDARDWPGLFRSIFAGTGVLLREIAESDGERRVTNYCHIAQILEDEAISSNMDIIDIAELLDFYRKNSKDMERLDHQRIDTERDKVRVMTMHSSKGLEYPIVFIAGGFNGDKSLSYYDYSDHTGRIFDPGTKTNGGTLANCHLDILRLQREDECRRLYYVALTRAKFKLYIPQYHGGKNPISTIVAPILSALPDYSSYWQRISTAKSAVKGVLEPGSANYSFDFGEDSKDRMPDNLIDDLMPKDISSHKNRVVGAESFTSLHGVRMGDDSFFEPIIDAQIGAEKSAVDEEESDGVLAEERLPKGEKTGSMLHSIFENADFASVVAAKSHSELLAPSNPMSSLIETYLRQFGISHPDNAPELTAQIVWNTLRTNLDEVGCRIGDLNERVCEIGFNFPFPAASSNLENITARDGYLNGAIDMVFRHNGRYYILDWKSNTSPDGSYDLPAIEAIMRERNYMTQYRLYTMALRRWLGELDGGFDYEKHFGGVYYIFLRGAECECDPAGIFFKREPQELFAKYDDMLFTALNFPEVAR